MRIYNTLARKKEPLPKVGRGKSVRLFVCGPTVYDFSHIGHARTYVAFDIIVRALRARGVPVQYLQNITDIEDKIFARAQKDGVSWKRVVRTFTHAYAKDMAALKVQSVNTYAVASDYIPQMIRQIKKLLRKGYAYRTATGVYFAVQRFSDYGKLSRQRPSHMKEAVRIDPDPTKKHFADFALWKLARKGEPSWPSPWGRGRPGWHIEDTAITRAHFGPQYELHGGALDLIFPHHESEIAQAEAAFGKKPFVRIWMHTGFLNLAGEKMAKSVGNVVTIREVLEAWPAEVFRMFVARTHYRSPVEYDEDLLHDAASALARIEDFVERLARTKAKRGASGIGAAAKKAQKAFWKALEDDFHTPRTLAAVFDFISAANPVLERGHVSTQEKKAIAGFLKEVDDVFGILSSKKKRAGPPPDAQKLVALREKLRQERKFKEADAIRAQLQEEGWIVEDTATGPHVKKKS